MQKEEFQKLIELARSTDLLSYFQSSGYTVNQKGDNYYIKEIAGLCIKPEQNQWYSHYTGKGKTNNSIDCLVEICGKSFNQAVLELTGKNITSMRSSEFPKEQIPQFTSPKKYVETEPKKLVMPVQSESATRLFAYLCQTRKIPNNVVEEFLQKKLMYQSNDIITSTVNGVQQTFKNANAIFIHRDETGKIIGGEVQGLNYFKRYKGICKGTGDSAFIFAPNPSIKPTKAYIFESAIDLMSFYTFCDRKKLENSLLVSIAGLKPTVPKKLQSEGIEVCSCVDNDDAGRKFEQENNFQRSKIAELYLDQKGVKDWNELLVIETQNPNSKMLENNEKAKVEFNNSRRGVRR